MSAMHNVESMCCNNEIPRLRVLQLFQSCAIHQKQCKSSGRGWLQETFSSTIKKGTSKARLWERCDSNLGNVTRPRSEST